MTGQIYPDQQGVNNLCYRGDRYKLDEVVPAGPMPYKVGVVNYKYGYPGTVRDTR